VNNENNLICERLSVLERRLRGIGIDGVMRSLSYLVSESDKNNPEAIRRLSELADQFLDLSVSFEHLAEFIDRKYPAE
jgi:hypothetical protein